MVKYWKMELHLVYEHNSTDLQTSHRLVSIYYVFFWVVPRRLNDIRRRFGTLYLFHLHRHRHTSYHLRMKMEQIGCSETSAYIIQTPGNYPKENIIYSEHGESLKSGIVSICYSGKVTCSLLAKYTNITRNDNDIIKSPSQYFSVDDYCLVNRSTLFAPMTVQSPFL